MKIVSARRGKKCSAMQEQKKDGAGDLGRLHGRGGQELGFVNRSMGVTFSGWLSLAMR